MASAATSTCSGGALQQLMSLVGHARGNARGTGAGDASPAQPTIGFRRMVQTSGDEVQAQPLTGFQRMAQARRESSASAERRSDPPPIPSPSTQRLRTALRGLDCLSDHAMTPIGLAVNTQPSSGASFDPSTPGAWESLRSRLKSIAGRAPVVRASSSCAAGPPRWPSTPPAAQAAPETAGQPQQVPASRARALTPPRPPKVPHSRLTRTAEGTSRGSAVETEGAQSDSSASTTVGLQELARRRQASLAAAARASAPTAQQPETTVWSPNALPPPPPTAWTRSTCTIEVGQYENLQATAGSFQAMAVEGGTPAVASESWVLGRDVRHDAVTSRQCEDISASTLAVHGGAAIAVESRSGSRSTRELSEDVEGTKETASPLLRLTAGCGPHSSCEHPEADQKEHSLAAQHQLNLRYEPREVEQKEHLLTALQRLPPSELHDLLADLRQSARQDHGRAVLMDATIASLLEPVDGIMAPMLVSQPAGAPEGPSPQVSWLSSEATVCTSSPLAVSPRRGHLPASATPEQQRTSEPFSGAVPLGPCSDLGTADADGKAAPEGPADEVSPSSHYIGATQTEGKAAAVAPVAEASQSSSFGGMVKADGKETPEGPVAEASPGSAWRWSAEGPEDNCAANVVDCDQAESAVVGETPSSRDTTAVLATAAARLQPLALARQNRWRHEIKRNDGDASSRSTGSTDSGASEEVRSAWRAVLEMPQIEGLSSAATAASSGTPHGGSGSDGGAGTRSTAETTGSAGRALSAGSGRPRRQCSQTPPGRPQIRRSGAASLGDAQVAARDPKQRRTDTSRERRSPSRERRPQRQTEKKQRPEHGGTVEALRPPTKRKPGLSATTPALAGETVGVADTHKPATPGTLGPAAAKPSAAVGVPQTRQLRQLSPVSLQLRRSQSAVVGKAAGPTSTKALGSTAARHTKADSGPRRLSPFCHAPLHLQQLRRPEEDAGSARSAESRGSGGSRAASARGSARESGSGEDGAPLDMARVADAHARLRAFRNANPGGIQRVDVPGLRFPTAVC